MHEDNSRAISLFPIVSWGNAIVQQLSCRDTKRLFLLERLHIENWQVDMNDDHIDPLDCIHLNRRFEFYFSVVCTNKIVH